MEPTKMSQEEAPQTEITTIASATTTTTATSASASTTTASNSDIMFLSKVLPKPIPGTAVRLYLIRHGETNWNQRGKIQGGGYDVPLNATGKAQAMRAASALEGIPFDVVASSSLSRAKETADIVFDQLHCTSNNNNNNNKKHKHKPLRIVDGGFNEMRFGKFEGFGYRKRKEDSAKESDNNKCLNESRLAVFLAARNKVATDREFCFPSRGDIGSENDDWSMDADDETFRIENDAGKGESTRCVEDRALEALSKTIARVFETDNDNEETTATATATKKIRHVVIVSHGRTNKVMISAMLSTTDTIGQGNTNISVLDHCGSEVGADGNADGSTWKTGWTSTLLNYTDHVEEI